MDDHRSAALNARNAEGIGLQVRFFWRGDRHGHTISVLAGDRATDVLESVEGTSADVWPPSPPLQQLSVEEIRPQTRVALLVGMAGKSHWSMSVEPAGDRTGFVFDVACRSRDPAGQLGSCYLLKADGRSTNGEHDATIEVEGRSIQLRCDHEGPAPACVKGDPSWLRIEPAVINSVGTTRWRCVIELQ